MLLDNGKTRVTFKMRPRQAGCPIKDIKQFILDNIKGSIQDLKVTPLADDLHFIHFETDNTELIKQIQADLEEKFILDDFTEESGPGKGIRA